MSHEHPVSEVDVLEHGAPKDGHPQTMDRRLFMQLLVMDCTAIRPAESLKNLAAELEQREVPSVLYEDVNQPSSIGLLSWSEDPTMFVRAVRPACNADKTFGLKVRPELTMLGRTYSSGYESDLNYWLLDRPRQTAKNPAWPWAVWYPLRRSGAFEELEGREKGGILREHAEIGRAYGAADLAHDIRLACHGLDANDNEFVIGLIGKALHPLSHVVQSMRKTKQTSRYISQMGPFFVGHAAWMSSHD
ncbi:MAG: chlorite dismutase family protein [Polyangiaceae bacterium]|nr:chlorite dismutase family protein [Polyangiaceae bacterium]